MTVGDKVVLAAQKRFKSDPTYGSEKFTILARDDAKIVVRSDRGVLYSRNVEDAKRIIEITDCPSQLDVEDDLDCTAGNAVENSVQEKLPMRTYSGMI